MKKDKKKPNNHRVSVPEDILKLIQALDSSWRRLAFMLGNPDIRNVEKEFEAVDKIRLQLGLLETDDCPVHMQ